jgi:hypothetical protein
MSLTPVVAVVVGLEMPRTYYWRTTTHEPKDHGLGNSAKLALLRTLPNLSRLPAQYHRAISESFTLK